MMGSFRFQTPYWFLLAPLALWAFWRAYHPRYRAAAMFSSLADLKDLPVTWMQKLKRALPWVYALGLALLIVALARPQAGVQESIVHTEGIAIEMLIDISGSMKAEDFELNGKSMSRVDTVKYVFEQFVEGIPDKGLSGRPNDLIGLVAFGGYPDSKCPLTLDHGALLDTLKSMDVIKLIFDRNGRPTNGDEQMTAIGDGLTLALDRLKSVEAKSKIVILLTDGDNDFGIVDPREAAKAAKAMGIKVYCIGIGHNGPVPFPYEDMYGQKHLDPNAVFPIDEELLKDIASTTGGRYWHASETEALTQVYADIDKLEKSKMDKLTYTEYSELYPWAALPGLALVLAVSFAGATRFRSLP
jgi:Ca-activated chloride channel family protein